MEIDKIQKTAIHDILDRLYNYADCHHYTDDNWINSDLQSRVLTNILLYEVLNELRSVRHLLENQGLGE